MSVPAEHQQTQLELLLSQTVQGQTQGHLGSLGRCLGWLSAGTLQSSCLSKLAHLTGSTRAGFSGEGEGQEVLNSNCGVFCSVLYEFLKPGYN